MFERSSKVGIGKGYMNQMSFLISITRGLYFQHRQLSEALTEPIRLSLGLLVWFLACEEQAGLCDSKFKFHMGCFLFFVECSFLFVLLCAWYRPENSVRYFQHQIHQFCLSYSFEKDVQYWFDTSNDGSFIALFCKMFQWLIVLTLSCRLIKLSTLKITTLYLFLSLSVFIFYKLFL